VKMPAPLSPAGVDLSGHDWFPFFPERLRKSKWWRRASDLARARNVMLWGEAWKSVPAGSLPDDDDELAEAAGFGMDAEAFIAAKPEIMAPWTLCSDGRWYHPTLCEQVLNAWERMDERRRNARERQARRRSRVAKSAPSVTPVEADVTCDMGDVTRENTIEERRGEERIHPVGSATPQAPKKDPEYPQAFELFWSTAGDQMRKRSSRKKSYPAWRSACRQSSEAAQQASIAAYVAQDEDFKRTRGPALHRWLNDGRWEAWLPTVTSPSARDDAFWRVALRLFREQGRWSDSLGPRPNQPGCNAPVALMAEFGMVDDVIPLHQRKAGAA
jgi:hypothetical protein